MQKKTFKLIFLVFGMLIVLGSMLAVGFVAVKHYEVSRNVELDSAPCRFKEFPGVLTVEEIRSNPSANAGKDMVIVFQFDPGTGNDPPHVKKDRGEIETTAAEINRLGIKTGSQFQTKAEYVISGFCLPGPFVKDLNTLK